MVVGERGSTERAEEVVVARRCDGDDVGVACDRERLDDVLADGASGAPDEDTSGSGGGRSGYGV